MFSTSVPMFETSLALPLPSSPVHESLVPTMFQHPSSSDFDLSLLALGSTRDGREPSLREPAELPDGPARRLGRFSPQLAVVACVSSADVRRGPAGARQRGAVREAVRGAWWWKERDFKSMVF